MLKFDNNTTWCGITRQISLGEEDDPILWDEVDDGSWSSEDGDIFTGSLAVTSSKTETLQYDSMIPAVTGRTKSGIFNSPQDENTISIDNPHLHHMQIEMNSLRTAISITRLCSKPKIFSRGANDSSRLMKKTCSRRVTFCSQTPFHMKLNWLFGPLYIPTLIAPPCIIIRQGDTTSRYLREFRRDGVPELNRYVFKRKPTPSLPGESYFCVDLVRDSPYLMGGASHSNKVTIREGGKVISLPYLLESINNLDDKNVILEDVFTYREKDSKSGSIIIFFERRALFLESKFQEVFDITPLNNEPATVEIILEYLDLYKLREWRKAERVSRERPKMISQKKEKDAKEKLWDDWRKLEEGIHVRNIFTWYLMGTALEYECLIVDILFSYSCEHLAAIGMDLKKARYLLHKTMLPYGYARPFLIYDL